MVLMYGVILWDLTIMKRPIDKTPAVVIDDTTGAADFAALNGTALVNGENPNGSFGDYQNIPICKS